MIAGVCTLLLARTELREGEMFRGAVGFLQGHTNLVDDLRVAGRYIAALGGVLLQVIQLDRIVCLVSLQSDANGLPLAHT